jgi:glycerate 2-kinase
VFFLGAEVEFRHNEALTIGHQDSFGTLGILTRILLTKSGMPKNLHILLAFDSFKGCLKSRKVGEHFAKGWSTRRPGDQITLLPLADGGEGTLEAFASMEGKMVSSELSIAASGEKEVYHLNLKPGKVVLEVAQTLGIEDLNSDSPPAMERSSSHFGRQFMARYEEGARHFMVGLGGSCTTDGGLGFLQELGLKGIGEAGEVPLLPSRLDEVQRLEWSPMVPMNDLNIEILSDVSNPLFGPRGACRVFGPQKGLSEEQAHALDREVMRIYDLLEPLLGVEVRNREGAGAAGGMGAALMTLGGNPRPGAEVLFDAIGLDKLLQKVDLVFSGEGRSDAQTVEGKGPFRLAQRAAKFRKKTILVSGAYDPKAHRILMDTFAGVHSILSGIMPLEGAVDLGWLHLEQAGANFASLLE